MTPVRTALPGFAHIATETPVGSRSFPVSSAAGGGSRAIGVVVLARGVATLALMVRTICLVLPALREGRRARPMAAYGCSAVCLLGCFLLGVAAITAMAALPTLFFGIGSLACLAGSLLAQRELSRLGARREVEHHAEIPIHRTELNEHPKNVLRQVTQPIQDGPPGQRWRLHIAFHHEMGIDGGGLQRALWTDLGNSLFSETDFDSRLPARREATSADRPQGNGWVPEVRAGHEVIDRENVHRLGCLMAVGVRQGALFPSVLAPALFNALHALVTGEESLRVLQALMEDRGVMEPLFRDAMSWTEGEWASMLSLAPLYLDEFPAEAEEGVQQAFVQRHYQELKAAIAQEPVQQNRLQMLNALAEGLERGNPGEVACLRGCTPAQIRERYTGRLDTDQLVQSIRPSIWSTAPREVVALRIQWLQHWLQDPLDVRGEPQEPAAREAQCQELRRRFLYNVTGGETLLVGEPIRLNIMDAGRNPRFHTCTNELDMPVDLATEAQFREALRHLMAVEDREFNGV